MSQEACGLELFFFSYFFFPLFVVICGLARGEALRYRGVSLLFHYISESPTKGRMKCKAGPSDQLLGWSQDCLGHPRAWFQEMLISECIIRDADEQSDEEVHKAKSGRSQAQGLLSPWRWAALPS